MKIVWNQPLTEIQTSKTRDNIKYKVRKKNKSTAESVKHCKKEVIDFNPEVPDTYYPTIQEMFGEE